MSKYEIDHRNPESPVNLNELAYNINQWAIEKGFFTPPGIFGEKNSDATLGKLMLIVTEIAEAAEAVRHGDLENFVEELADTQIRLLQLCGAMGIDLDLAVDMKMMVNADRPHRHGKITTL